MSDKVTQHQRDLAARLVSTHGDTFAERAGVHLDDEPDALWQLHLVAQLLSARIRADAALASARELFAIGCTSPSGTRATSWRQRVDALGRGGYRRYDFSTSTRLGENATMIRDRWTDDLRRLRDDADADPKRIVELLQEFDGIGPTGAGIFVREVQSTWNLSAAFVDKLTAKGATAAGLPTNAADLAGLVAPKEFAALCAALVVVARRPGVIDELGVLDEPAEGARASTDHA